MPMSAGKLDIRVQGTVGRITLTKPARLNALDIDMCSNIIETLLEWETDLSIQSIVVDAEGGAFCAGGDIKDTYAWTFGRQKEADALWRLEHQMVILVKTYSKPIVTVMHGLVLGGGVGLGCHAQYRLVTETAQVGMPEVAIGLSPDVGGLHLWSRAPHNIGYYLALTAKRVSARDAICFGFADYLLPAGKRALFIEKLIRGADLESLCNELNSDREEKFIMAGSDLYQKFARCDRLATCFDSETIEEILDRLISIGSPFTLEAVRMIKKMAPMAVKVTLRALRNARKNNNLTSILIEDLRRNVHFSYNSDLREGIRAMVIDKDRCPNWSYKRLSDVPDLRVEEYFGPIAGGDLDVDTILERGSRREKMKR